MSDDDDLAAEYLDAAAWRRNLGGHCCHGDEECLAMLARVLRRLPKLAGIDVHLYCHFVMAPAEGAAYLSERLLENSAVIALDPGLLELSEEEQADVVLPLVAKALARCPDPDERVDAPGLDRACNRETGALYPAAFARGMRELRDARANLRIDVHQGGQRAAALLADWRERWAAYQRGEPVPTTYSFAGKSNQASNS